MIAARSRSSRTTVRAALLAATAVILVTGVAAAHHSFAMFDKDKRTTIEVVVTEVQWTNPHVYLEVVVPQETNAAARHLSLECASISILKSLGWTRSLVKPGDPITVTYLPLKDGRPGGLMDSVRLANGRSLGNGNQGVVY